MDINELRQLIKKSTSVLVMDNGEPAFVILDYPTYKKEVLNTPVTTEPVAPATVESKDTELMERLNKEILALKAQIEAEEKKTLDWTD